MSDTHRTEPRYHVYAIPPHAVEHPEKTHFIYDALTDRIEFRHITRESALHIASRLNRTSDQEENER